MRRRTRADTYAWTRRRDASRRKKMSQLFQTSVTLKDGSINFKRPKICEDSSKFLFFTIFGPNASSREDPFEDFCLNKQNE